MKVSITGTGYVGLVTGACLAEMGNQVLCFDTDAGKVARLGVGDVPIFEPGLTELVRRNLDAGRLAFTTDADLAADHGQLQFIAVGTPAGEDGSADLSHVLAAAREIGRRMSSPKVLVDKSTVPVGTAARVEAVVREALAQRGLELSFTVVSNPEFLKEGSAVDDFMRPDRVVIGSDDARAVQLMKTLYAPFIRNRDRLLVMDVRSAEFTKYAANAMLATRISFMNELSRLAEKTGVDIELVRQGIGSDPRIGTHFLYAGCGYGGSCFPKDVQALLRTGAEAGEPLRLLRAVEAVNQEQKQWLVDQVVARYGADLSDRSFALWGLAFKPGTDDLRQAPSADVITGLLARGARLTVYDPVAMPAARLQWPEGSRLRYAPDALSALDGADALVLVTEWREFRSVEPQALAARLREPVVFDGRNVFDPAAMRDCGIEHHGVGRGSVPPGAATEASAPAAEPTGCH